MLEKTPSVVFRKSAPSRLSTTQESTVVRLVNYRIATVVGYEVQPCRTFVGYEAQSKGHVSERPVERGTIQNWDQMETIWEHVYSELGVCSTDQPLVLADGLEDIASGRMKMAKVFFEKFNVPSIFINSQAAFSMYAGGQSSGISVDSGHSTTRVVHVYQGWAMPYTQTVDSIAGTFVSGQLEYLLKQKLAIPDGLPSVVLQHIKERLCYTSLDFSTDDREYNHTMEQTFELPDGQVIELGKERFRAPEALFNPGIFDPHWVGSSGIPGAVLATIMKSDEDLRRSLFRQIVLVCTLYPRVSKHP